MQSCLNFTTFVHQLKIQKSMKHILPSLFSLLFALNLLAQPSLSIHPDVLDFTMQADLSDLWAEPIAHSYVVNTSNQTIKLRWEIKLVGPNCPAEWKYKVCDKNQCYSSNVTTNVNFGGQPNVPVVLAPGDTSIIDVHVNPTGVAGCCEVEISLSDVTDINNPVDIESPEYDICITALSAVTAAEKSRLRVYPNPTTDFITLTKNDFVKELWVTNILGRRVKTFTTSLNGKYDMSQLPDGIYLVSMVDASNKIVKTVRVSKRNIRP